MPGTDVRRISFRGRVPGRWNYVFPLAFVAGFVATRAWWLLAWAALTAAQVYLPRRGSTVLTPTHLETGLLRRNRLPWAQVRAVRASEHLPRVSAVLADGGEVSLRGVHWYAPRVEGMAPPGSAQDVVEWARAHGHDVALTSV